jgi:hypothetical protein
LKVSADKQLPPIFIESFLGCYLLGVPNEVPIEFGELSPFRGTFKVFGHDYIAQLLEAYVRHGILSFLGPFVSLSKPISNKGECILGLCYVVFRIAV